MEADSLSTDVIITEPDSLSRRVFITEPGLLKALAIIFKNDSLLLHAEINRV